MANSLLKSDQLKKKFMMVLILSCIAGGAFSFANCSPASNKKEVDPSANEADIADGDGNYLQNANYKSAILALVAGTYGQNCFRKVDGQLQTNGGSPISFTNSGVASVLTYSHDLTKSLTTDFSVVVSHVDQMVASKFDIKDPTTGDRVAVYSVGVAANGSAVAATVSVQQGPTELDFGCAGPKPAASGMNLWNVARKFISVNRQDLQCFDSKTSQTTTGAGVFSDVEMQIGSYKIAKGAAQSETLSVQDEESAVAMGLQFMTTDANGQTAVVAIRSNGQLESLHVKRSDGTAVQCSP